MGPLPRNRRYGGTIKLQLEDGLLPGPAEASPVIPEAGVVDYGTPRAQRNPQPIISREIARIRAGDGPFGMQASTGRIPGTPSNERTFGAKVWSVKAV